MNRLARQIIVGGIFLIIIGVPAWFLYRVLVPAPSCSDGVKNGAEEGIDCGAAACGVLCPAPVEQLQVAAPIILKTGANAYDVLVRLDNTNAVYGASRVEYAMTLADAGGETLASRRGTTYVNPAQPRYVLFTLADISGTPVDAQLQFTQADVQWNTLAVESAGAVQFAVRSDQFTTTSKSARYEAIVANRSAFTFDEVDVVVLLYDSSGAIVGANTTILHTLAAGEQRSFVVHWPFAVPDVQRAQAIVTTNIFANDNFVKTYGSPEKFQEY